MLVQVFPHALVKSCNALIDFLDALIELEVLLFHQAHLHQRCLVTCLERLICFNQIFKLHDKCTEFDGTLVHLGHLHLERATVSCSAIIDSTGS